jgi:fluoroacetyl-CoA thioesterase
MTVAIDVQVKSMEGRKISFDVAVKDDLDAIGSGSHTRFVVEKARTLERIKAKAARVAGRKR